MISIQFQLRGHSTLRCGMLELVQDSGVLDPVLMCSVLSAALGAACTLIVLRLAPRGQKREFLSTAFESKYGQLVLTMPRCGQLPAMRAQRRDQMGASSAADADNER